MALGEEIALETLEAANQMAREATDFRKLTRDGERLRANAVADGVCHPLGQAGLELGCRLGKRLDLRARSLQRRVDRGRSGLLQTPVRSPNHGLVHREANATVDVG